MSEESYERVIAVLSGVIGIFGTVANTFSSSYFNKITKPNSGTRNSDETTNRLFNSLTFIDLCFCVITAISVVIVVAFEFFDSPYLFFILNRLCLTCVLFTAFFTCFLSVARAIHNVKYTAVNISLAVYVVIILILQFTGMTVTLFLILFCVFLTVILSNVISICKLCFSQSSLAETREATITVAILSAIFSVCTTGSVIIWGLSAIFPQTYHSIPIELIPISHFILLPLKSACNPLFFLMRIKDMREHSKTLCDKFAGLVCWKNANVENETDLEL